ncbi:urease accessory protein UreD [Maritimibacter sp. UBA3975]|uniref:urease accessory protein UreD n=1 Tax=Maritimibacter sp. UBA3975 TaxID=1946833 RepID=UPI000C098378|nr:urease accessory protein UreD [Maritimibacter sp. UBA3975]MAM62178.1 urease accessory protein [Maritimibacter sp.]|tara:strand:- start:6617 stop:7453 length:837 start_codon:yes stop_codon:yes gene_type:complete
MNLHPGAIAEHEASQPRARGQVRVTSKRRDGRSVIDDLAMSGSMKLLFPRPSGDALDAMLINTAGGVTGGDRFFVEAGAGPGTTLTLTTQAAERAYAARGETAGRIETHLSVAADARLNWLPQETILFDNMNFERGLTADLDSGARFLMVEPLVLGRVAMGERLRAGRFRDRVEIRVGGRPVYLDGVALTGDVEAQMARPATMNGARAVAALVYAGPDAEAWLAPMRRLMPETGGVSLHSPGLLTCRIVAPDSFALRKALIPAMRLMNADEIPRPWML